MLLLVLVILLVAYSLMYKYLLLGRIPILERSPNKLSLVVHLVINLVILVRLQSRGRVPAAGFSLVGPTPILASFPLLVPLLLLDEEHVLLHLVIWVERVLKELLLLLHVGWRIVDQLLVWNELLD